MKTIRDRFEEIWPVPDCIIWNERWGEYMPNEKGMPANRIADEWGARLDTFTRCQETTDVYVSLVEELVQELELAAEWVEKKKQGDRIDSLIERAKQIMEQKK